MPVRDPARNDGEENPEQNVFRSCHVHSFHWEEELWWRVESRWMVGARKDG